MFEDIPKLVELGTLGVINIILIMKGIDKMQLLSQSVFALTGKLDDFTDNLKSLTESVFKLTAQNEALVRRFELIENRIVNLENLLRNLNRKS